MTTLSRRKAREAAMRAMYEVEFGHISANLAIEGAIEEMKLDGERADFANRAVLEIMNNLDYLDRKISSLIPNYSWDRVAAIDRNVMRIAAYELFYEPAIPPAVTIDEAVEIAKKYSTEESGKFVNGVLAKLLAYSPKANWTPSDSVNEFEAQPEAPPEIEPEDPLVADEDVEVLNVDDPKTKRLARIGGWTLNTQPEPEENQP